MEEISFRKGNPDHEEKLDKRISRAFNAAITPEDYEQKLEEFRQLCKKREKGRTMEKILRK